MDKNNITNEQLDKLIERIKHWNAMPDLDVSKLDHNDFYMLLNFIDLEYKKDQELIDRLIVLILYIINHQGEK